MPANQFYTNGSNAQIRSRAFTTASKSSLENKCVLLQLNSLQVGSITLTPGDKHQKRYPDRRRCVVFTTGPFGSYCKPPPSATFIFGDSSSDVGNNEYLTASSPYVYNFDPYGRDFIPRNGRASDGRLVEDLLANASGLPLLPPFLKPNSNFAFGVNFASSGSGALPGTNCALDTLCTSLATQVQNFESIKSSYSKKVLSKSICSISTGSNDFQVYFSSKALQESLSVSVYDAQIIASIEASVTQLYKYGVRKFVLSDVGALGCKPQFMAARNVTSCVTPLNSAAFQHTAAMVNLAVRLNSKFPKIRVVVAKTFNFFILAASFPGIFGFKHALTACCGGGLLNGVIQCGNDGYTVCSDASKYIFWDLAHPTQAAYEQLAVIYAYGSEPFMYPYGTALLTSL